LTGFSFPLQIEPFLGHYVQVERCCGWLPSVYPNRIVFVLEEPVVILGSDRWQGKDKIQVVYYIPVGSADEEAPLQESAW